VNITVGSSGVIENDKYGRQRIGGTLRLMSSDGTVRECAIAKLILVYGELDLCFFFFMFISLLRFAYFCMCVCVQYRYQIHHTHKKMKTHNNNATSISNNKLNTGAISGQRYSRLL
jgi:uncharacterized membrane protein